MFQRHFPRACHMANGAAFAAILLLGPASAGAQTAAVPVEVGTGRIDFASADLPSATVEVDLSQEIFGDLFGLGDAAIAGVLEALTQSSEAQGSETTKLAAEELAAARQVVDLAKDVVREVRVRVYHELAAEQGNAVEFAAHLDQQLGNDQWDRVAKVQNGNDAVHVSLLRVEGSILGVFVVVADGKDVVLVNVVCEVSPENVKKLTAAATKIGLKHGLSDVIEHKLKRHVH